MGTLCIQYTYIYVYNLYVCIQTNTTFGIRKRKRMRSRVNYTGRVAMIRRDECFFFLFLFWNFVIVFRWSNLDNSPENGSESCSKSFPPKSILLSSGGARGWQVGMSQPVCSGKAPKATSEKAQEKEKKHRKRSGIKRRKLPSKWKKKKKEGWK